MLDKCGGGLVQVCVMVGVYRSVLEDPGSGVLPASVRLLACASGGAYLLLEQGP